MQKWKRILLIIAITLIVLVTVMVLGMKWFGDYSVDMSQVSGIPEPVGSLPDIVPDSTGWPSWKGLTLNNHAAFTNIKTDWSGGLELLWDVDYLCKGEQSVTWSCPAVSGNHLVIPGRHDSVDIIFCLDPIKGILLWTHAFDAPAGNPSYGEGPRATPTIDGDRVYVLSRGGILLCLSLKDGSVIWEKTYIADLGAVVPKWGFAGSPVLFGDKTLIVQVGNTALVYGLDKYTGEILWQSGPAPASYSTPVVIQHQDKPLLLVVGGQAFFAIDPTTGTDLWQIPWEVKNNINICTPVYSPRHEIAVISSWYRKGSEAVRIDRERAVVRWHNNDLEAHQADPLILDDYLYGFSGMSAHNRDKFKCLDLLTGEVQWASSELGSGQFIYVEPYILSVNIKGSVYLSLPSPEGLEVVTKIDQLIETDNAKFWTKPVLAQGNLYLRYANRLYCYKLSL